jgi:secreted PhoX family phosphatase
VGDGKHYRFVPQKPRNKITNLSNDGVRYAGDIAASGKKRWFSLGILDLLRGRTGNKE